MSTPMVSNSSYTLYLGDCLEVMRGLPDNSVDSICTDPPYGLRFMGKSWDYEVPSVAIWREALRVLKPGGHLLSFGGSRTYHRMTVNIEDAGFEIRDQVMWVYGSGFPKSRSISKDMDRIAGVTREITGVRKAPGMAKQNILQGAQNRTTIEFTAYSDTPISDAAKEWQGWGTALKPAFEPICLARKPLSAKTVAANVLLHGTGAMNIDACRVPLQGDADAAEFENNHRVTERLPADREGEALGLHDGGWKQLVGEAVIPTGRWPANLIHDGSDEVVGAFPDAGGQQGDLKKQDHSVPKGNAFGQYGPKLEHNARGDKGTAARFFYAAKASRKDRNEGCESFADCAPTHGVDGVKGGLQVSDSKLPNKNSHPTVKPTELMRYLCRLVTPAGGLVLDPFMGSGSTGKAAMFEDFNFIGIEQDEKYLEIARARIGAVTGEDLV